MADLGDPWFEAQFYGAATATTHRDLDGIEGAQGIQFWCPCGYGKAEYPLDGARPHAVMVPFANPRNAPQLPPDHGPTSRDDAAHHPRWTMTGTGISDLTLAPSVDVGNPGCWHGFVTNGVVT